MKLRFERTCFACPEQYNVYDENDIRVAYVRLRWGCLTIEIPDCNGELIYEHCFDDECKGMFTDEERESFIYLIEQLITKKLCGEKE